VSRWSSKPLAVRVGHGSVQACDPGTRAAAAPAVAFDPGAARSDAGSLESVLQALLGAAGAAARGATFEIATESCRFEVVGWIDGVTSREHRAALARGRFEAVYGPGARDWKIQVAEGGYRRGGLAVALPGTLLSGIQGACRRAGVAPGAIRPAAGACIDRLLRKASGATAWIVVPDRADVFVGLVDRGSWLAALCIALPAGGLLAGLADVLARESALVPDDTGDARVLVCPASRDVAGDKPGATPAPGIRWLEGGDLRWPLQWVEG